MKWVLTGSLWVVFCVLQSGVSVEAAGADRPATGETDATVFCIGRFDGLGTEFGPWDVLGKDRPVVFVVGRDRPKAWPSLQPSHNDKWAGSRAHTYTIRFTAKAANGAPLFLLIGLTNSHPSEPSEVTVAVNGAALPVQRAPKGEGHNAGAGKPGMMRFEAPRGAVRAGENTITVTLAKGSWIGYDYVALRTDPKPPPWINPLEDVVENALNGVDEIAFAVRQPGKDIHYYANFGYWSLDPDKKLYGDGGQLAALSVKTGKVRLLVDDPRGGVRDPQVHYDGGKILFSYRKGGTPYYHLYEINVDGTGLRQLTDGPFDDIEPTHLPDGGIVFCSSRCKRFVGCWFVHVATLYRCDGDGGNIRVVSSSVTTENTPSVLPDGRVLFTRWEYVDRSQIAYHSLWSMNPDGTGIMTFYGNMYPTGRSMVPERIPGTPLMQFKNVGGGPVMIDAKAIPGSSEVVSIFSPGHGRTEHAGPVVIVDPDAGPDARGYARAIVRRAEFRDPWPLNRAWFLVARGRQILAMNRGGNAIPIHTIRCRYRGVQVHEPAPIRPRTREPVIPRRVRPEKTTGTATLADVTYGRKMGGVKPGEIRKLLVLENLPPPVHMNGGMDGITNMGSFYLTRILGTIPVEPDGSAYMELPALRSLYFVALDEKNRSVKRMQSFLTLQPGETIGCAGCHEQRSKTPPLRSALKATQKPPRTPEPIPWAPDVFDFPRDVQPILDRRCLACHDYDKRSGGVILTGDRGQVYSHSYYTLVARGEVMDGRNAHGNRAPRAIGSSASRLMRRLEPAHHSVTVTDRERDLIALWIDASAPYAGTYAHMASGRVGISKADQKPFFTVLNRRCHTRHNTGIHTPRELLFNLSRPEKSLALLAPLAKASGGYGACAAKQKKPPVITGTDRTFAGTGQVFADTADTDYRTLLGVIATIKKRLDTVKRFDMPDFRPNRHYLREMQRYGILPRPLPPDADLDPYALDRAYWRSLWYEPTRD